MKALIRKVPGAKGVVNSVVVGSVADVERAMLPLVGVVGLRVVLTVSNVVLLFLADGLCTLGYLVDELEVTFSLSLVSVSVFVVKIIRVDLNVVGRGVIAFVLRVVFSFTITCIISTMLVIASSRRSYHHYCQTR